MHSTGEAPDEFAAAVDQLAAALDRATAPAPGLTMWSVAWSLPLLDTTDTPVAAVYQRTRRRGGSPPYPGSPYGLAIPHTGDLALWLRAFLQFLHTRDPTAVPTPLPVMSAPHHWYTPTEAAVAGRLAAINDQRIQLDTDQKAAEAELATLGVAADAVERAVLCTNGDDLVAAVTRLLDDGLGFAVIAVDQLLAGQPRQEDLRVSPPDDPATVVVVEVKGYQKGARTSDLQQINQHVKNYIATHHGAQPHATWWVFNDHPPSIPAPGRSPCPGPRTSRHIAG